jgi:hypothetical protein
MRWKSNQDITPTFSIEFGKNAFYTESAKRVKKISKLIFQVAFSV